MSFQNGQRVPAWKRLGLKLKGPASAESPAPASSANPATTASAATPSPSSVNAGIKRKQPPSTAAPITRAPEKRQRIDPSPKKTVKFSEDTKEPAAKAATEPKKAPKKPKEKKPKSKPATEPAEAFNLEPSLAYLRQWHTNRDSWKFNKNHQTLLIKYFFDINAVPAAVVPIFLAYIRDLKGFVRTRLREQATEIKKKDMANGAAGFSQVKEKADKDSKQELYEEVLLKLLQLPVGGEDDDPAATESSGKRNFDEVDFSTEEMDVDVRQRVIKRMRAERVLQELSDSDESTTSDATATTTTSTATPAVEEAEPAAAPAAAKAGKPSDGAQPPKRRRLRKSRTADISDDSSSESESDSDSDSDSSSSESSDDEEDEEMPLANGDGAESSSSSSSSESDSDSDDESDSGAGAKVGQDEDDSSSDSEDSG
jgi:hypothetical protein